MKLRRPPDVAWVALDEDGERPQVFAMRVPSDPPVVLGEWAAVIWLAAARGELDQDWIAELPDDQVRASVPGFVAQLVDQGLLEQVDR